MKPTRPETPAPADATRRRAVRPVICYPTETLPAPNLAAMRAARAAMSVTARVTVPPREGRAFNVPRGSVFRIVSVDGPQVGDLNLFNAENLDERFFSGKTRALHGTHLSTGDRMWSSLPYLRPLATILRDSLDWYGFDADGGSVHDVIGTRCDPYTNAVLGHDPYHHCCHSNLTRALVAETDLPVARAERLVHDVLNVFMCTGFTRATHQYFMKASPVRPGDALEFFAEQDLLGVLSACPGGDCGSGHSSDAAACHPLAVEILGPPVPWDAPAPAPYTGNHAIG